MIHHYDFDLFVIGGGSGGVRAARMAGQRGARVALAECAELGGTCVNVGCVPKKLYSYAAGYAAAFEEAPGYGWTLPEAPRFDWATLKRQRAQEITRLNGIYERIKHGAKFEELARLYSQDGSAAKGGDLGWIYPGDTVPDFERAMNELPIGVVSTPVQSPFGFHLIQVIERRVQEASNERKRSAVRQILRERKMDEAYQDWLRQERDRAYVELRLDEQ